jgi:hypothetical protein
MKVGFLLGIIIFVLSLQNLYALFPSGDRAESITPGISSEMLVNAGQRVPYANIANLDRYPTAIPGLDFDENTLSQGDVIVVNPGESIQSAIDIAISGDTILVMQGTAPETVYTGALTINKAVHLVASQYDANNPMNNTVVIDGDGAAAVITISPGISGQPSINGFVIRNGSNDGIYPKSAFTVENSYFYGAGDLIDYENGSGGLTRNNVFFGASDDALDLDNQSQPLVIEGNRLLSSAEDGIEIRLQDSSAPPNLIDIIIRDNEIRGSGHDGIQFIDFSQTLDTNRRFYIEGNLFADNSRAAIGLMANQNTNEECLAGGPDSGADIIEAIRVYNNTLHNNPCGISGGDNLVAFNNILSNSDIRDVSGGNSIVDHSLVFGGQVVNSTLGTDNLLGVDPLFAEMDRFSLQPGSPAVDACVTQYTAPNGELVPLSPISEYNGSAPDLGWLESEGPDPTPSPTPTPFDYPNEVFLPMLKNDPDPLFRLRGGRKNI